MPVDWSARRERGRFLLGGLALIVIGAGSCYLGYQDGEHLAAAWSRVTLGAIVATIGLVGLLLFALSSAARRERMLFSASAMRSRRVRVSGWVASASLVIGAFVFAYVYAATRV
ncbi:hypothetical protein PI87_26775 [Ralstonia sp. A12]|uniref:hypothetical protein n=1 Tax=Ralstonia sp. A12 TaxID=1217052 RepID=UPI000573E2F9|nr:hypothetical protein [Ralstonia sp. A12]KHK49200.1 hypothetical protein PI87_26775 [Ralstonia sp. A12]